MTILTVAGVAAMSFAWFFYWFTKEGLSGWAIAAVGVFVLFFAALAIHGFLPGPEERMATHLQADEQASTTIGTVLSFRRLGTQETETQRYSRLGLTVDMLAEGGSRKVKLELRVEDALVPSFASGRIIHLLYDRNDDTRVAVDRRYTPLSVQ